MFLGLTGFFVFSEIGDILNHPERANRLFQRFFFTPCPKCENTQSQLLNKTSPEVQVNWPRWEAGGGVAIQSYEVCGRRISIQWWADSPQVSFAMETRQVFRLLGLIVITSAWSATHGWARRTTCLCLFLLLPHTAFCSRFACAATRISPRISCWPPGPSSWGSKHPYQSPSWAPRRSMCLLISLTETRCWPWTPPPSEEVRAFECHQILSLNYWKLNGFCFIGKTQLLTLPAVSIPTLRPRSISSSSQCSSPEAGKHSSWRATLGCRCWWTG